MRNKSVFNKIADYFYLKFLHLKYTYTFYFSHHPLCDKYKNHIYKIGNMYICKGCFHTYSGFSVLSILYLILSLNKISFFFSIFESVYGLLLNLLFLFPLIVDILNIKVPRIIKNLFRQMLGYAIATALFVIIFSSILFKFISILVMIITYIKLKIARKSKKYNICITCEEYDLNSSQACSGFSFSVKQLLKFSEKASKHFQNNWK